MTDITRRRFLQGVGIGFANLPLSEMPNRLSPFQFDAETTPPYGRAFATATVYASPEDGQPASGEIAADTVVRVVEQHDDWYRLESGYVRHTALQPLSAAPRYAENPAQPPFWAEVVSAAASIRAWCAPDAPLITRIGHGGVSYIDDVLLGSPQEPNWYRTAAPDGTFAGWTATSHWLPCQPMTFAPLIDHIRIDKRAFQLDAFADHQLVRSIRVSIGGTVPSGTVRIGRGAFGGNHPPYFGSAWHVGAVGSGWSIAGVYWHNEWGRANAVPFVQVTISTARWLYAHLADTAIASVIG